MGFAESLVAGRAVVDQRTDHRETVGAHTEELSGGSYLDLAGAVGAEPVGHFRNVGRSRSASFVSQLRSGVDRKLVVELLDFECEFPNRVLKGLNP